MHFLALFMYTRWLGHSTLSTIALERIRSLCTFRYRDALRIHTCISEYWRPDLPHKYLWSWRSAFWNGQKAGFLERPENRFFRLQKALRLV